MKLFKNFDSYNSIDTLPVGNWFAIQKTNDVTYLLIKKRKVNNIEQNKLEAQFENIYKEFINTFGMSDTMRKVLELKASIAVDNCDMYLNNDRSKITFINIKKKELEDLLKANDAIELDNTKGYVEKYMGFRLNTNEVTVRDYYGYVKMLEEHIEQTKKQTVDVG